LWFPFVRGKGQATTIKPTRKSKTITRRFGSLLLAVVMVWFGLVWFGLVWFGLVWFGFCFSF
jgi:hypothetical protein